MFYVPSVVERRESRCQCASNHHLLCFYFYSSVLFSMRALVLLSSPEPKTRSVHQRNSKDTSIPVCQVNIEHNDTDGGGGTQVQNSLASLGLVDVLTTMFDKLDWFASQPRSESRGIHGLGCACNPKSVSSIQNISLMQYP